MPRIRGRRVAMLLASVLPLVAEDSGLPPQQQHHHPEHATSATLASVAASATSNYVQNRAEVEGDDDAVITPSTKAEVDRDSSNSSPDEEEEEERRPLHVAEEGGADDDSEDGETHGEKHQKTGEQHPKASAETATSCPNKSSSDGSSSSSSTTNTGATTSPQWSLSSLDDLTTSTTTTPWSALEYTEPSQHSEDGSMTSFSNVVLPLRPYTPWNLSSTSAFFQQYSSKRSATSSSSREGGAAVTNQSQTTTAKETSSSATCAVDETPEKDTDDEKLDEEKQTESTPDSADDSTTAKETKEEEEQKKQAEEEEESAAAKEKQQQQQAPRVVVDYASKSAGALVLEKSANFEGTSNLLTKNKDQYAIVPCEQDIKSVVIGLSEDILVKQVILANYERYSSPIREFSIAGSTTAVDEDDWKDLGTYTAQEKVTKQTFDLTEPSWARYLKFSFLTHYGDEHYCTISQISVHGSTMLQGFHEQWVEEKEEEAEAAVGEETQASSEGSTAEETAAESADGAKEKDIGEDDSSDDESDVVCAVTTHGHRHRGRNDFEKRMRLPSTDDALSALSSKCPSAQANESAGRHAEVISQGALGVVALTRPSRKPRPDGPILLVVNNSSGNNNNNLRVDSTSTSPKFRAPSRTDSPTVQQLRARIKKTTGLEITLEDRIARQRRPVRPADDETESARAAAVDSDSSPEPETSSVSSTSSSSSSSAEEPPETAGAVEEESAAAEEEPASAGTTNAADPVRGEKSDGDTPQATKEAAIEQQSAESSSTTSSLKDSMRETDLALAKVLERLPSAECLEKLEFATFKNRILEARSARASGTIGGTLQGHTMEPIFKKLTDEIRALQASVAVHDSFAVESVLCYQRILLDLVVEMETHRITQDARLSELEKNSDLVGRFKAWAVQWVAIMQSVYEWMLPHLSSAGQKLDELLSSDAVQDYTNHTNQIVLHALMLLAMCVICVQFVFRVIFRRARLSKATNM